MSKTRGAASSGFTLVEVMVTSSLSLLVMTAVLTCFVWNAQGASLCAKIAWSQNEARDSATKLTMHVRTASAIVAIDQVEGRWVQLGFNDGTTARLVYTNAAPGLRNGQLYMRRANGTELIVARGLTEIQDSRGFTTPVFTRTRANALRIAYRVSEPTARGGRDANDGMYAACTRFAACLRNTEP